MTSRLIWKEVKSWLGSAGESFPECLSDEGLWQYSGRAPPDFGTYPGTACSILPYPVQPSLAILGRGPTRYWTQLENT